MAFTFQKYGTFTGPSQDIEYRNNDDFSLEPFEGYWNIPDVSMVLVNTLVSPDDYVYMHLDGSSTSTVTLERNAGPIPTFNVEADTTNFSGDVLIDGDCDVNGVLSANNFYWGGDDLISKAAIWDSKKSFDIKHPTKENYRLRYICLEGPAADVFYRGKLKNQNIIQLPDYWKDLVDLESIGVNLTPIGRWQELYVEKIQWGTQIVVKNNSGSEVNCDFVIFGERKDVSKNISEYPGITLEDYPGDNREYVINGRPLDTDP